MSHAVRDWRRYVLLPPMRACLQGAPEIAGLAGLYAGNAAVIGQEDAMGAVLVFEPNRGGPAR